MSSSFEFLRAAIKAPLQTSTFIQTSSFLAQKLVNPLVVDPHCTVLELGVGAGAVTGKIHKCIFNRQNYFGIEINEDLYNFVVKKYPDFKFQCASAEGLSHHTEFKKFDLIIATLPWSIFDRHLQRTIIQEVSQHLDKGGYFKTYLAANALATNSGKHFIKLLQERFVIQAQWEFLNIPPAKVFECRLK